MPQTTWLHQANEYIASGNVLTQENDKLLKHKVQAVKTGGRPMKGPSLKSKLKQWTSGMFSNEGPQPLTLTTNTALISRCSSSGFGQHRAQELRRSRTCPLSELTH